MMAEEINEKLLAAVMNPERLYHQAPCGYITFTTDGTIIKINDTLLKWLGYTHEEIVGKKKFSDLLSKGGQIHFEMFFRPMLGIDGTAKELAYELLTKKGNLFQVIFSAVAISDEAGQMLAINGIFTDNTDRKRYEQELINSKKKADLERRKLTHFFMQMPAGVCILDGPDFTFELVNPLYQQLFPGRELIGKKLVEALPELKDQEIFNILISVYQTGQTFEGRELLVPLRRTMDGPVEDRYFNFIYQARVDENNQIDGILVFVIEVTEMIVAQQQVLENQQNLQTLVMTAHYALMILRGPDYVVEMANQQLASLWNRPLEEINGKKLLDILPELQDQSFPKLLNAVRQTGTPYGQQEELLRLIINGKEQTKYVSFYYDPIFDQFGSVSGVIVAAEDITAQVKVRKELEDSYTEQRALNEELASINEELAATNEELTDTHASLQQMVTNFEESESRLRSVVESAPFPIGVYVGAEMRIMLANQNIIEVWGKGNDVIGKSYKEILPELYDQAIFSQLDGVLSTGKPFHARNQRVDILIDGEIKTFYFNYSFTPLLDTSGNVYGVMNTAADVTDLNLAKQVIERSEQNLNAMILQAPVAICILLGPDHVIQVANELMIELWGKPVDEVMHKPVFEALPDARNQGLEKIIADVYYTGHAFTTSEMPVSLLRNGKEEVVYQNFVYEPFKDADGVIIGVIAITIDVTEQVLARQKIELNEKELRNTKDQLELQLEAGRKIQRQKDDFIGMASHELKTPLTSLTAIIQVANGKLKQSNDPFLSGAMDRAQVQVKRMIAMINGFLNISRLESGKMVIDKKRFNIDQLIREMIDEIQLIAPGHLLRLAECAPIPVEADRDKIGSVLTNLFSNAVKYSPKGKLINVNCKVSGQLVEISVQDEGMGITPGDAEKIFDRYYRVESANTRHISGFGIGLYLSAEIIEQHGGRIWVASDPGQGSTFYFTLPLS